MNDHAQQPVATDEQEALLYDEPLTTREEEVLALVAHGYTNKDVADLLVITESTVRNHLHAVYRKLGIEASGKSSRIEASLRAQILRYAGQEPDEDAPKTNRKDGTKGRSTLAD